MAYPTNTYPTSIQDTTNPSASDQVGAFDHAGLESFQNDSIEALKNKVGADGSVVTTSHTYKLSGATGSDKAATLAGTETLSNKTLTAPRIANNGHIDDSNGNEQIEFVQTASAVNNVRVTNAATGNAPLIDANGTDANIDLSLKGKGSGNVKFGTANIKLPNADGTNGDVLSTNGAGVASWVSGSSLSDSSITITTGENITAGDAVMVADGSEAKILSAFSNTNTTGEDIGGTNWYYQSFTTSSTTTMIKRVRGVFTSNGSTGTFTVRIRSTPNGSDLASVTSGNPNGTTAFTFNLAVSPSTTYYIVMDWDNAGNPVSWRGGTTSSYSGGVPGKSTNSGSTWVATTNVTGDFAFAVFESYTTAGRVYRTSADSGEYVGTGWTTNFIGIARASASAAASLSVQINNAYTSFSGLTPGLTYYLSNTPGAIASSAGTVSKKIGISLASTTLLIKQDN